MSDILDIAANTGQNAANQLVGAGLGLLLQGGQDRRQLRQQQALQNMQMKGALQMWKDTNYPAQMEQIKKAGLNPGLLYGMGGAGGATTGGISGGQAPHGGGEALAMAQSTASMGLMKAQKDNLNANTEATLAGIPGHRAEGPLKEAQTGSLLQGIENQKVQKALMEIQDSILRQELWERYTTQDNRVQAFANAAKEGIEKVKQMMIQTGLDQRTVDDKVLLLQAQRIVEGVKGILGGKHIQLAQQEWEQNISKLIMAWRQDGRQEAITNTQVMQAFGNLGPADKDPVVEMIQDLMNGILIPVPGKRTPIGYK